MVKKSLYAVFFFFLALSSFAGAVWEGKVIGVRDGETIIVFDGKNPPVSVHLNGVAGAGEGAKEFLSGMVFGKMVVIEREKRDDDGGIFADVIMPDGKSLNEEMLQQDFMEHPTSDMGDVAPAASDDSVAPVQAAAGHAISGGSAKNSSSSSLHERQPIEVPGVRIWRDDKGVIHFSGTAGERE